MSTGFLDAEGTVSFQTTLVVKDACLCRHVQRAARVLARRFDVALKGVGLTNGQFSLMMSLNRPALPSDVGSAGTGSAGMSEVAQLLGMDRTTLTAAAKTLERRDLLEVLVDAKDRRGRRMRLTVEGRRALTAAVPIWVREHGALEQELAAAGTNSDGVRRDLGLLAGYIGTSCSGDS
jgi:DNA-binding MarR family transcriptional regulator